MYTFFRCTVLFLLVVFTVRAKAQSPTTIPVDIQVNTEAYIKGFDLISFKREMLELLNKKAKGQLIFTDEQEKPRYTLRLTVKDFTVPEKILLGTYVVEKVVSSSGGSMNPPISARSTGPSVTPTTLAQYATMRFGAELSEGGNTKQLIPVGDERRYRLTESAKSTNMILKMI